MFEERLNWGARGRDGWHSSVDVDAGRSTKVSELLGDEGCWFEVVGVVVTDRLQTWKFCSPVTTTVATICVICFVFRTKLVVGGYAPTTKAKRSDVDLSTGGDVGIVAEAAESGTVTDEGLVVAEGSGLRACDGH